MQWYRKRVYFFDRPFLPEEYIILLGMGCYTENNICIQKNVKLINQIYQFGCDYSVTLYTTDLFFFTRGEMSLSRLFLLPWFNISGKKRILICFILIISANYLRNFKYICSFARDRTLRLASAGLIVQWYRPIILINTGHVVYSGPQKSVCGVCSAARIMIISRGFYNIRITLGRCILHKSSMWSILHFVGLYIDIPSLIMIP